MILVTVSRFHRSARGAGIARIGREPCANAPAQLVHSVVPPGGGRHASNHRIVRSERPRSAPPARHAAADIGHRSSRDRSVQRSGTGRVHPVELAGTMQRPEAADRWNVRRVCLASTIRVYAGATGTSGPLHEDTQLPLAARASLDTDACPFGPPHGPRRVVRTANRGPTT